MSNVPEQSKHTPTPWVVFNMTHAERGGPMTAAEIGEYVRNNVLKSIEDGGDMGRFLFISTGEAGAPDICHVGNGPRGPANAAFIVEACNNYEALQSQNAELVKALQFARGEAITARGVLWTKADAAEAWPDGKRHSEGLRRSAEKLDDVVSECDAALTKARP